MGLWKNAEWIFADVKYEVKDRYFEYITSFQAEIGKETLLYISAYSQYAVYVNGHFVNCGQYDDYEELKFYDVFPITEFIIPGDNELLVCQYVAGADFSTRRKQIPGVIFTVIAGEKVLCTSTTDCLSREDLRFCGKAEQLTKQMCFNFEYDANVWLPQYTPSVLVSKDKKLKERPVKKLVITKDGKSRLVAQGVFLEWNQEARKAERCQHAYFSALRKQELMRTEVEKTKLKQEYSWRIPETFRGDGVYLVFDLGGEKAGFLDFSLTVPQKCEVLISIGEHLDDLRVRSSVGERNFTFRYLAKEGKNEFFYPFQRFGLRYLQFMIYSSEGSISRAIVREATYPLTYQKITVCDNLHRMIWEMGRRTLELCMHEHYEDCPWREQSLYAMDSRVQMLCGYYAFGEYEFPKANLRIMAHSLRKDKLLELCAPGKVPVNIPSFTAVFVRQVLEYIQYSGDRSFADEMLPVMKIIVEGFEEKISKNGLIPQLEKQWNFYEWQEGINGEDRNPQPVYDSLLNSFVSDAFSCFTKIAEIAEPALADRYRKLHENINKNIHKYFFRKEYSGYATYMEEDRPRHDLTQAMLLYTGAVPKELRSTVAGTLKSGVLLPCTLSMSIYEYDALMDVSEKNHAYISKKIERIWGRMLRSRTDTFWETALGADDFDYAGSLCHGWSAVPIYIFGKYGVPECQ